MATSFVSHGGLLVQSVVFESFNLSLFNGTSFLLSCRAAYPKELVFYVNNLSRAVYLKQHKLIDLRWGREFWSRRACLRAPPVVADEAKLAIVFTYIFLLFSFLFFFSYAFCVSPTSGNLPCVKISPNILA